MNPLLIGAGVGAGLWLLNQFFGQKEREAYGEWQRKRASVKRSIEEHRQHVENYVRGAQSVYDFHQLCDVHFSSFKVADHAYALLKDARVAERGITQTINAAIKEKRRLGSRLNGGRLNPADRSQIHQERRDLESMIVSLQKEQKTLRSQRDDFQAEVQRFNRTTRRLKLAIRDNCGARGRDWYDRLEARRSSRRN